MLCSPGPGGLTAVCSGTAHSAGQPCRATSQVTSLTLWRGTGQREIRQGVGKHVQRRSARGWLGTQFLVWKDGGGCASGTCQLPRENSKEQFQDQTRRQATTPLKREGESLLYPSHPVFICFSVLMRLMRKYQPGITWPDGDGGSLPPQAVCTAAIIFLQLLRRLVGSGGSLLPLQVPACVGLEPEEVKLAGCEC